MNGTASSNPSRVLALLSTLLAIAVLYLARDFLVPLALATLISFLLAPLTRLLERWRLGRIGAVITATALCFTIIGVVGYIIGGQLVDLANQVSSYKANLSEKIAAFKATPDGPLDRLAGTFRDLTQQIMGDSPATPAPVAVEKTPMPVSVVSTPASAIEALGRFVAPVLAPLGTAAIVIAFVIFMLLGREDLRDRLIHLVGRGHLHITTQALDDVGNRVSRYLLAQVIVNVTYGIPIAIGLYFIGVPNAVLWGFLATILRFVPYLGPTLATAFPLALSVAVSPSWTMPLLTGGLFVVVELISNNVVEPWLYGSSTGLSPLAIVVSAVFWTWLWGVTGLLLATPLTVCLAVAGKYIPALSFLDVLLGDKPPIANEERFYQRLLATDPEEALALAEDHVTKNGLAGCFDTLLLPALLQAERDARTGVLDEQARHGICDEMRDLIAELGDVPSPAAENALALCLPANNDLDELGGLMLARILGASGVAMRVLPSKLMSGEVVEETVAAAPRLVCISVVSTSSLLAATQLCKKLRARLDDTVVCVGIWGDPAEDDARRVQRVKRTHAHQVFTSLAQAAAEIRAQPSLILGAVPPQQSAA